MLVKTGWWWKAATLVLGGATLFSLGCEPELDVESFELERLESSDAAALVSPYVYPDRDGAPGMLDFNDRVLTVRETPENLRRIREVLSEYDKAPANLTLHFQLIEANGFQNRDEAIADVEAELRGLLRYEGYRLVGDAVVQLREGDGAQQQVDRVGGGGPAEEPPFQIEVRVSRVRGEGENVTADVAVALYHPWYDNLLQTRVTVGSGKAMVLGTTSAGQGDAEAMILVVRPTVLTAR